jgi:hypothetical protein
MSAMSRAERCFAPCSSSLSAMSLSRERLDEICEDIRHTHKTTIPIVVESLLFNHTEHDNSKKLAEHGLQITELLATHPNASGDLDQWAEDCTIAACHGAAKSLLLTPRREDWAANATSMRDGKLGVVEGWSLNESARRLKQYGALLWQVIEGVVKRPGIAVRFDETVEHTKEQEPAQNGNGQVDIEYKATHKHTSQAQSCDASLLMIVSGSYPDVRICTEHHCLTATAITANIADHRQHVRTRGSNPGCTV